MSRIPIGSQTLGADIHGPGLHERYPEVNLHGGAISIGHPLGASGVRLMTTLLSVLERTRGRFGLQTMCEAGGLANATIIERL